MTNAISQWLPGIEKSLTKHSPHPVSLEFREISESMDHNSLWFTIDSDKDYQLAIRSCFDPQGLKSYKRNIISDHAAEYEVIGSIGQFRIWLENLNGVIHYRTSFTPVEEMTIKAFPKDVYILGNDFKPLPDQGEVHVQQAGPAAGIAFFSVKPQQESILYFQDLTSLNDYFQQTETAPDSIVSAQWPEIGTNLPESKKPLAKDKEIILSDAYLVFSGKPLSGDAAQAQFFIDAIANVYGHIQKPDTEYFDWPKMSSKAIDSMMTCKDCYREIKGDYYLNAYVGSAEKPPESMVQYTLLIPLMEYQHWAGKPFKLTEKLFNNVGNFFDKKLGSMTRWLPGTDFDKKDRSEEEYPEIMDSWYLFHILGNLGRIAQAGHEQSQVNFLSSVNYAMKIARKFKGKDWPVFFHNKTFKIIKAETEEGKGGEQDVPGVYAHVMWQAYQLTRNEKYLKEAEEGLSQLKGKGFKLLYQTNNTAITAQTAFELYKHTGKKDYLDISIVCIANIIAKMWIWDCNFNFGKVRSTFMGVLPLHNAPYLAAYEEAEVFAVFSEYLKTTQDEVSPSIHLMLSEFMKYTLHRGRYYYPSELPPEMLNEKPKEGKIIRDLPIPLEDLQTGWKKSGEVGQEVYGSNLPFIMCSYAYHRFENVPFTIYCDYPVLQSKIEGNVITLQLGGTKEYECRLGLFAQDKNLPQINIPGIKLKTSKAHKECILKGGSEVQITWKDV